ncbi:hypothetical protein FRC12_005260 [Ceratobasidium sp. 428]|nr:hypothetical protein FRC12_005260 [Ceratobasidium sp. 428]
MRFDTLLNFLLTLLCLFSVGLSSPTPATGAAGDAAPDALVKRESSLLRLSKPNPLSEIDEKDRGQCDMCEDRWSCCWRPTFCCVIGGRKKCCQWV